MKVLRWLRLCDQWGISFFGMICSVLLGCAAIVLVSLLLTIAIGRNAGRTSCHNWSVETGIQTKFAVLYWADTGKCLAKAPDGRWVLNTRVQVYIPGAKK
jgi:hypothetical protein